MITLLLTGQNIFVMQDANEAELGALDEINYNEELLQATCSDDRNLVQQALNHGANINFKGIFGMTALMWATLYENGVFQLLIDSQANVDEQSNAGQTALMISIYSNNIHLIKTLLNAGSNLNIQSNNQKTVLMLAEEEYIDVLQTYLQALIETDRFVEQMNLIDREHIQALYNKFDALDQRTEEQEAILDAFHQYFNPGLK